VDDADRLARALHAIDAANAEDPTTVTVRGRTGPKELLHAQLVTEWVRALDPDASEALLLAARGHHVRRWMSPRASYPAGRGGYLRWRKALHEQHARDMGTLLAQVGYEEQVVLRVQALVRKQGLGRDDEVQTLEDALCLVFVETQLMDVAARLDPETLTRVLVKTADKMSAAGTRALAELPLDADARALLDRALGSAGPAAVVRAYLDGLAAHDWHAVAASLAPDVERIGPYRDVYNGRDVYTAFLRDTIESLRGYELRVARVLEAGTTVIVELTETVDDKGGRLRTDEAVVFDVDPTSRLITRVAVYLQTSEHRGVAPEALA
jgi:limonene-1,2-epoxide hydrolase